MYPWNLWCLLAVEGRLPIDPSRKERILELLQLEEERQHSILIAETVQKRRKAWADRHGKQKLFVKGDHVLVFNSKMGKHQGKLKIRWQGPYIIEEEVAPRNFTLRREVFQNTPSHEYPVHTHELGTHGWEPQPTKKCGRDTNEKENS